jgi:hypothetical protein
VLECFFRGYVNFGSKLIRRRRMMRSAFQLERLAGAAIAFVLVMSMLAQDAHAAKGRVRIESSPPNAAIYIDDKAGGIKGYTPATLRVTTGTRKIILEAKGYKTLEQFITVKRRKKTIHLELEKIPETAKLHFIADPNIGDAHVSVDGEDKGPISDDLEISSGRHLLEIKKEGYQKWSRWFELQQAEKRDVDVKLELDVGEVKVIAQPSVKDAFVYINDENKGAAPWSGKLPPGRYKVNIKAPGYTAMPQTVLIESGQKAEVSLQMVDDSAKEKTGKLSVASEPATDESLVFIDGLNKGPSPWSGIIPSGHHKIEVRAPDYACDPETIFVKGNQQNAVTIKLYPIASLNASVNVDKAEVFIDESSIGFTPLEDLNIPAKRSTLYIRKEGYKEYKEVIFPNKGETITVNAVLEHAPAEGMSNYLSLKFTFGLFGPNKLETDDNRIDDEGTTYGPSDTKMAVALGYMHLFNSYIGLGLHVGFTYFGLGGDLALDIDPMLRFQVPIMVKGRRLVEFYLGLATGFTGYFNKGDPDEDLYEMGENDEDILTRNADRTGAAFGWNLMTPLGVQFNVVDFFGFFIEGAWTIHKTYGKLDTPPSGPEDFEFMWMEVGIGAGIAFIF